jgi:peptide/nickel transport system permease protein
MTLALFVVRRLGRVVAVIAGLMVVTFFLTRATNDPVRIMLGPNGTQEQYERLKHALGFDQPLLTQFGRYLADLSHGDFGISVWQNQPALDLILEKLPASILLAGTAMLLAVPLGITLGVIGGLRPGSWSDRLTTAISALALAVPDFWLGIIAIIVFSVHLDWLPTGTYLGLGAPQYLVLPAVTAALLPAGRLARVARESVIEELGKQYVTAARARGLRTGQIVRRHVLKNISVATGTLAGYDFLLMFTGSITTLEIVFAWPGIGRLAVEATIREDVILLSAIVLVTGALIGIGNLVLDVVYAAIDRRIAA